jgi:esterase/lipase
MREAERSEAAGDYDRAASQAFLGQVIVSPHHPVKGWFWQTLQRCHLEDRKRRFDGTVERVSLAEGRLIGIWERPTTITRRPVLLLPPLASTKEELAVLSIPLLEQGHSVLRLDMPGQGESPCPLTPNTEVLLRDAMDEMGFTETEGIIVGGISLGSYFGLRLAAIDPRRVRAAFAVSPPAIVTEEDWARQMEIIWQYLDIYFGCADRSETHKLALNLHMEGIAEEIRCPVLMYQGTLDRINVTNARELYRTMLKNAQVTDFLLPDLHACPWHLSPRIAPEVVGWIQRVTEEATDAPRH